MPREFEDLLIKLVSNWNYTIGEFDSSFVDSEELAEIMEELQYLVDYPPETRGGQNG